VKAIHTGISVTSCANAGATATTMSITATTAIKTDKRDFILQPPEIQNPSL
jgi:hypothetical protein